MKKILVGLTVLVVSLPSFASYKIICETGRGADQRITNQIDNWSDKGYEVELISFESKIVSKDSSYGLANRDCAVIKVKRSE